MDIFEGGEGGEGGRGKEGRNRSGSSGRHIIKKMPLWVPGNLETQH